MWVCLAEDPPSFEDEVIGAVADRLGDEHLIDGYDVATWRWAVGSSTTSRRTGS